jgi:cation transport regulator ChaC
MNNKQKPNGRTKRFEMRLTEEEEKQLVNLEKQLGLTRSEIIRKCVLEKSGTLIINSQNLLITLDTIGVELGRSGNNVNQLARHANVLNKRGLLNESVVKEFNKLFSEYTRIRNDTEKSLRQIIRLIRG